MSPAATSSAPAVSAPIPNGLGEVGGSRGRELGELGVEALRLGLECLAAAGEVSEREFAGGESVARLSGTELGRLANEPAGRESA